ALRAFGEARANERIEDGESKRAARTKKPFHGKSKRHLQTSRCAIELSGKKLVEPEHVENRIGNAERAAKLFAASREDNVLAAHFLKMNGQVQSAIGFA